MKAPDKIYLPKEEIEERMPWIAAPYEDDPNWDECYIRKEALLKWLKDNAPVEASVYGFMGGYMAAYKQVIDKLNEM